MAELADASDSKSDYGDIVWVRFPLSAVKTVLIKSVRFFVTYKFAVNRVFKPSPRGEGGEHSESDEGKIRR